MKFSKKTKILSAVGLTVVAIGLILAFRKPKENKLEIKESKNPKLSSPKNRFPLETGSGMGSKAHQNSDVQKLQEALNKEYELLANTLSVGSGLGDGSFVLGDGSFFRTEDYKIDFLLKNGIKPLKTDGKFGKLTAELLDLFYMIKKVNEEMFNKIINK